MATHPACSQMLVCVHLQLTATLRVDAHSVMWLKFADAEKSVSFHKSSHMVAERGNGPRQKRSRGDRCRESRDVNRNREDEDEIEKQMGSGVDRAERRKHDETEIEIQYQKVVEQGTEVPRTSSRDRTLQCTEEQILDVLVPETTKQLVEVPETVS